MADYKDYFLKIMEFHSSYHEHKERMAWTASALYFTYTFVHCCPVR